MYMNISMGILLRYILLLILVYVEVLNSFHFRIDLVGFFIKTSLSSTSFSSMMSKNVIKCI